jgi:hypothetical protein
MKPKGTPRNPFVVLAKFRKAGSHTKPVKSLRRHERQALAKTAKQLPESWHKHISSENAFVMISASFIPMQPFYDGHMLSRCTVRHRLFNQTKNRTRKLLRQRSIESTIINPT